MMELLEAVTVDGRGGAADASVRGLGSGVEMGLDDVAADWEAGLDELRAVAESDVSNQAWRSWRVAATFERGMALLEAMAREATVEEADAVFGVMLRVARAARADLPEVVGSRPGFYWCETLARAWALMARCWWEEELGAVVLMGRLQNLCAMTRGRQPKVAPATAAERADDLARLAGLGSAGRDGDAVLLEDEWRMSGRDGRRARDGRWVFLDACHWSGSEFVGALLALDRIEDARWVLDVFLTNGKVARGGETWDAARARRMISRWEGGRAWFGR